MLTSAAGLLVVVRLHAVVQQPSMDFTVDLQVNASTNVDFDGASASNIHKILLLYYFRLYCSVVSLLTGYKLNFFPFDPNPGPNINQNRLENFQLKDAGFGLLSKIP